MDWAEDCIGIGEEDFRKVWKYDERYTTVVQLTTRDELPAVRSLKSEKEWKAWFDSNDFPRIDDGDSPSGLVLILAKRIGEQEFTMPERTSSQDWLSRYSDEFPMITNHKRVLTFAALAGKCPQAPLSNGQRSVRTLPFSETTFRLISKNFCIHHSISSVVSRADIPAFFSAEVEMEVDTGEAYITEVYHSRTTNAWEMDLALTVTHFPHSRLTYAVLFGCPLSVEEEIIRRVSRTRPPEASHPLVLAGIFAELERSRHVVTVERMIDKLESRIFELDFSSNYTNQNLEEEKTRQQQEKRDDYLDTAYLRNGLISWRNQLMKMIERAQELENSQFGPKPQIPTPCPTVSPDGISKPSLNGKIGAKQLEDEIASEYMNIPPGTIGISSGRMRRAGRKIIGRLQAIIDEYDDKIRDCSMRLDGMAMATQWAQGETNVEIALATGRDSKHMRSIAIVTMVFLPGTFFASVFSMSFFSWFNDSGSSEAKVSSYIWIYITVTVVFTVFTIGLWYYFNIWRQAGKREAEEEQPLV